MGQFGNKIMQNIGNVTKTKVWPFYEPTCCVTDSFGFHVTQHNFF